MIDEEEQACSQHTYIYTFISLTPLSIGIINDAGEK